MKTLARLFSFLGALCLIGASAAVNASSVPPIYNENTILFGIGPPGGPFVGATSINIVAPVSGNFKFTLTNLGDPGSPIWPPFESLYWNINDGMDTIYDNNNESVEYGTPNSFLGPLTAGTVYFVDVVGEMGAPSVFNLGRFNLEVVQVIPIPAAAVLFSSAIFGLVVVARRRSKPAEIISN